jgi:hypothetical protein
MINPMTISHPRGSGRHRVERVMVVYPSFIFLVYLSMVGLHILLMLWYCWFFLSDGPVKCYTGDYYAVVTVSIRGSCKSMLTTCYCWYLALGTLDIDMAGYAIMMLKSRLDYFWIISGVILSKAASKQRMLIFIHVELSGLIPSWWALVDLVLLWAV